jgi:hypothetical protein
LNAFLKRTAIAEFFRGYKFKPKRLDRVPGEEIVEINTIDGFAKNNLLQGLNLLERLWLRDFVPADMERHYFLFWFAACQGDLLQTAEALQVHQNTVRFHFLRFGFSDKSESLRNLWRKLNEKSRKDYFEFNFCRFHRLADGKNELNYGENKRLIRLWQTGFSFTAISAHYMLWALRNHKSKKWIRKKLGYSTQHCMRVLVSLLDSRSPNSRWLAHLKPMRDEIYTRLPKNTPMKNRESQRLTLIQ